MFRPYFLGDKFPTLDFLVELVGKVKKAAFFFVQVKATTLGYTKTGQNQRLKVSVSAQDVQRLVSYPAPTYVVGVDERREVGHLVSVNEPLAGPIWGLSTEFPLNCTNLRRLWSEVNGYWEHRETALNGSFFRPEG